MCDCNCKGLSAVDKVLLHHGYGNVPPMFCRPGRTQQIETSSTTDIEVKSSDFAPNGNLWFRISGHAIDIELVTATGAEFLYAAFSDGGSLICISSLAKGDYTLRITNESSFQDATFQLYPYQNFMGA